MTDIEKAKIDILRDALKDASDTVRALDRKINFLVSYNAVFLGFIITIFFKNEIIKKLLPNNYENFYIFLGILGFIWVCVFIAIMLGIAPKSNPIEVFKEDDDKKFANDVFFIFTDAKKESLKLNKMLANFNEIKFHNDIQKLLYKEIGKVSFIRDTKLKSVNHSVTASSILTFVFLLGVLAFYFSSGKEEHSTTTSSNSNYNTDINDSNKIKQNMTNKDKNVSK